MSNKESIPQDEKEQTKSSKKTVKSEVHLPRTKKETERNEFESEDEGLYEFENEIEEGEPGKEGRDKDERNNPSNREQPRQTNKERKPRLTN